MVAKVALALLLLSPDDWSSASGAFKNALQGSNDTRLEKAIVDVVKDNSGRAAKLLLSGLATPNDKFYWLIIAGLSKITDKEGVGEIEKTILAKSTPTALKRDLLMAYQLNSCAAVDESLLRIASGGTPDLQLTAIDELVKRGKKDAIPVLIEIVRKEEKKGSELLRQAQKALTNLTGVQMDSADTWQAWWDKNRETFRVGEAPKSEGGGNTVVETIKRNRTTDYEDLKKGKKEEVVVVSGVFDEVQKVLEKLAIPHTVITKADFDKQDLSKCMVLLINCDDYNQQRFTKPQLERIRAFVAGGGYLFTSDWGLVDVLEDAFPGYVKKAGELPQMNVEILPKKGSTGHPFLKDVFIKIIAEGGGGKSSTQLEEKIDHKWEIDEVSYTIDYDASKVVVLVESPELARETKYTAVAVTFSFGDGGKERPGVTTGGVYEELPKLKGGKVLHILSHFGKQKNKNDDFALQNMLLNFMIEAKDRKRLKKK